MFLRHGLTNRLSEIQTVTHAMLAKIATQREVTAASSFHPPSSSPPPMDLVQLEFLSPLSVHGQKTKLTLRTRPVHKDIFKLHLPVSNSKPLQITGSAYRKTILTGSTLRASRRRCLGCQHHQRTSKGSSHRLGRSLTPTEVTYFRNI